MDAAQLAETLARRSPSLPDGAVTSLLLHNNYGLLGHRDLGAGSFATRVLSTMVVELQLSYCGIGPRGAKALGEALGSSRGLSSLSLTGNSIGVYGMCCILDALARRDRRGGGGAGSNTTPDWRPPLMHLGLAANKPEAGDGEPRPSLDALCEVGLVGASLL